MAGGPKLVSWRAGAKMVGELGRGILAGRGDRTQEMFNLEEDSYRIAVLNSSEAQKLFSEDIVDQVRRFFPVELIRNSSPFQHS